MRRLIFTNDMIKRSKIKSNSLGSLNRSITGGIGNFAGYMGEEVISNYIGSTIMSSDKGDEKYNHDIVTESGLKIEVKTKRRIVDPKEYYDVSVAKSSMHQIPDIYAFVSITCNACVQKFPRSYKGFNRVWLCGFITADEFLEKSIFLKKGEIDENNGFTVKVDMYNMKIRDLYDEIQLCC